MSPTQWQKSLYPAEFQNKIRVIHEGIDTTIVKPDKAAALTLPDGTTLSKDMEVVTYTARGLEPYRGFHVFMKAAEEICHRRQRCHIVITGGVYLTVPCVLSWSMLEAMAAGCVVIGSKTPPVEEFMEDGRNGLLVDFFSPQKIADRVDEVLDHPDRMLHLGQAARRDIIEHCEVKKKLAEYRTLYASLLHRRLKT